MDEINDILKNCEVILYRGFNTTIASDSEWLNVSVCTANPFYFLDSFLEIKGALGYSK